MIDPKLTERWINNENDHHLHPYNFPPLDQDSQLMWPLEEEWSVCAPKPLLPQGYLPLSRLRAEWGAEEEKGAGLPQPDRRLPQIFQGGLHGLDIGCTDSLLALWWAVPWSIPLNTRHSIHVLIHCKNRMLFLSITDFLKHEEICWCRLFETD